MWRLFSGFFCALFVLQCGASDCLTKNVTIPLEFNPTTVLKVTVPTSVQVYAVIGTEWSITLHATTARSAVLSNTITKTSASNSYASVIVDNGKSSASMRYSDTRSGYGKVWVGIIIMGLGLMMGVSHRGLSLLMLVIALLFCVPSTYSAMSIDCDMGTYVITYPPAGTVIINNKIDGSTPSPVVNPTPAPNPTPTPTSASNNPTPAPNNPTPAPNNPTPAPNNPTPAPNNPTPAPNNPTPAPNNPTPAPNNPTPAPNNPTPAPNNPTPAPTPAPVQVDCVDISGPTSGATTNSVGAAASGFPSSIPSCGTFTAAITYSSAAQQRYLIVDTGMSAPPYTWYGKGNCTINAGTSGTKLVTVTLQNTVPTTGNIQLSLWLVLNTDYDANPSTAYQKAVSPPGQVGVAVSVTSKNCNCVASCSNKVCGNDGCGGVCGNCTGTTSICRVDQSNCVAPCPSNTWNPNGYAPDNGACTACKACTGATVSACTARSDTVCQGDGIPRLRGINLSGGEFGCNPSYCNTGGTDPTNYKMPITSDIDFFYGKGMNAFRLPVTWERLTPTIGGNLDTYYTGLMDNLVTYGTGKGMYVIIDIHNYARYNLPGGVQTISASGSVNYNHFASLWSNLATKYKTNAKVLFGLMNEPHDMSTEVWLGAAQAAINAIRTAGATNLILVPGNGYTGAHWWVNGASYGTASGAVMTGITDPGKNFVFEVHQYLDGDSSGTSYDCAGSTIGSDRLADFTAWCRQHGYKAILGEFGGQTQSSCQSAVTDVLDYMNSTSRALDVYVGWTWWVGGNAYYYYDQNTQQAYYIHNTGGSRGVIGQAMLDWMTPYFSYAPPFTTGY